MGSRGPYFIVEVIAMGFFKGYTMWQKMRFLVLSPAIFTLGVIYVTCGLGLHYADIAGDVMARWVKGK